MEGNWKEGQKVRLLCRARVGLCRWPALSWNYFSALPQRRGLAVPSLATCQSLRSQARRSQLLGGVNWKPRIGQLLFASMSSWHKVSTNQSWKLPPAVCLAWQNTECTWRRRTKTDLASRSRALWAFTAWNLINLAPSQHIAASVSTAGVSIWAILHWRGICAWESSVNVNPATFFVHGILSWKTEGP